MTVKELIEQLQKMEPTMQVVAWDPDKDEYDDVTGIHGEGQFVWIKTEDV